MKRFLPGDLCQIPPSVPIVYAYKEILTKDTKDVEWDLCVNEIKPGDIVFFLKESTWKSSSIGFTDPPDNYCQVLTKKGLRWIHYYDLMEYSDYKRKSG